MERGRPLLQIVGYQRAGYRAGIMGTAKFGVAVFVGAGLLHIGYQLTQWALR